MKATDLIIRLQRLVEQEGDKEIEVELGNSEDEEYTICIKQRGE